MKRFTILLLSLMTLGMYAQTPTPISISTDFDVDYGDRRKGETMIWEAKDFNPDETNTTTLGVWGDSNPQVVVNPDKDGINQNDKCLKLTCSDTDGFFKMHLPSGFNLNGRRRISMLYKGVGKEFYAQLELVDEYSGGSNNWKLGAYQDVDGWKRLYFDFTPYDEGTGDGYINVADEPDVLVFKPKIKDKDYAIQNSLAGDVYYIDEIKVEDVPYAEGYWIHDNTHWPKGTFNADATPKWNTDDCELPIDGSNGVLHLSGTWLKGRNIVNSDCETANTESDPKNIAGYWVYEFNEYRDLSWHVKPDEVKLMVFNKDSKLRWPDRGGLLGTNTGTPEAAQGYPDRFINNLNVLIFAEKSCILPDEVDNLDANWHDTNAVVHYGSNVWKTWDLELTDDYPFLNPQQFTVQNTIKLHRTMKPGFNTITYPFYVTAAELQSARVGSIYFGINDENLLFVTASQTEPNKPYITDKFTPLFDADRGINVTANYQEIHLSAERSVLPVDEDYTGYSSDATSGTLYGTYKRISGKDKWAIVTDGSWQGFMQGGEGSTIKPFRGYLDILPNAASAGARSLSILDDDATGMGTGMVNDIETVETIYDLQGRAIKAGGLSSLPKGIYIINGKKTMIK